MGSVKPPSTSCSSDWGSAASKPSTSSSPDPDYHAKWKAILQAFQEAVEHPDEVVLLFQDELTYYRQPSKAPAYERRGRGLQPRAHQQPRSNTQTRITAVLHGVTGRVTYLQMSKVGEKALITFYAQIRAVGVSPGQENLLGARQLAHTQIAQRLGGCSGATPDAFVLANLCLLAQSHREAVALAEAASVALAPTRRRPRPITRSGLQLPKPVRCRFGRVTALRRAITELDC